MHTVMAAAAIAASTVTASKTAQVHIQLTPTKSEAEIEADFVSRTNPAGSKYRQWVKPSELHTVLGAPETAVAATLAYVQSLSGASEASTYVTKNAVKVSVQEGSAAAAAFGLASPVHFGEALDVYRIQAPVTPATIAAYTTDVLVQGGDKKEVSAVKPIVQKAADASCKPVSPPMIKTTYGVPLTKTSAPADYSHGVGEFEAGYFLKADLDTFWNKYSLPAPALTTVGPNPDNGNGNADCAIEVELDMEYIGATGAGIPLAFIGQNQSSSRPGQINFGWWCNSVLAMKQVPSVVSLSWGLTNKGYAHHPGWFKHDNSMFRALATAGITVFAASGDAGPGTRDGFCSTFMASWPSSSPALTSVGATQMNQDDTEAVWNEQGDSSGGGFSDVDPLQSWQKTAVQNYLSAGSASGGPMPPAALYNKSGRAYPDMAAYGRNVQMYASMYGGWMPVGGTSCAAPITAGLISRINAERMSNSKDALGYINKKIYSLGKVGNDITTGKSLDYCDGAQGPARGHGFPAAVGWDAGSGLGSPSYTYLSDNL